MKNYFAGFLKLGKFSDNTTPRGLITMAEEELENKNLITFKYCDKNGDVNEHSNPNGSSNNIAGLLNSNKNILGLMPHPERVIDPLLSNEDGSMLFESLLK